MALTTEQLKFYSWMSQASYLDFQGTGSLQAQLISSQINQDKIFASEQANTFTAPAISYSFISHAPNDSSGFSATVFKSNADGSYTIAVRGTEPGLFSGFFSDLLNADVIGVALEGAAYEQAISADRYYKQLTAGTGKSVSYSQAELNMLSDMYITAYGLPVVSPGTELDTFLTTIQQDVGIADVPTDAPVNFTGHSLGGHVATLLAAMVNQCGSGVIGDVATYNAPGMGGIFNLADVSLDVQAISGHITNLIGEGGMTVTPNVGTTSGQTDLLFIETASINPVDDHSIVKLSDFLAVYDLFAKVAPGLDTDPNGLATITGILEASSSTASNSLESAVSANDDFHAAKRLAA
ncbi:hypothetical protein FEF65_13025 [Mariprofundus erugo]|uniref:Fungal lipase-type domain-containing protein n=1 Tax=Mariprofundus erugo TaxID=2528639 RepID=A0A5R9GE13_9PROT|nr:lipase family protein [Mariprofundus erugo]TLS65381.1 hypothetical protein FEF65_13025 [Mariprofundus erugo]